MTRWGGWLALLAGGTWAMAADPTADAGAPRPGPAWRLEAAATLADASPLALDRGERLLAWTDPPPARAAERVVLLVEAPFAAVRPAVEQALAALGRFEISSDEGPLASQRDRWDEVLLSRRPDLRAALARGVVEPRLREAERAGLLTPDEVARRLADAHASVSSLPQDRAALPAFAVSYPGARFTRSRRFGLTGRSHWELEVATFDASAAFGRPTTAVILGRTDTFPNPDYSFLRSLRDWNILSRGPSPTLVQLTVPADVFAALRQASIAAAGGVEPRVAPSELWWTLPVEAPPGPPVPRRVEAAAGGAPLPRVEVGWAALTGMEDANRYPHDLAALADGSLLLSAEVLAGRPARAWSTRLWRLRPGLEGGAEQVWQGGEGATRLAVNAGGDQAWFVGSEQRGGPRRLLRYRAAKGELTAYEVALGGEALELEQLEWELDARGAPAFLVHAYATSPGHQALYQRVVADEAAPDGGGRWGFRVAVSSAREAQLGARLTPVRWAGGERLWTEDAAGLAQLDAASGRTVRALPMPWRFEGGGRAQWVPAPLGSPAARWIAVGSVAEGPAGGGDGARAVGMQVVDLDRGQVAFEAHLGPASTLGAAARSAGGRLLALGTGAPARVGLWEVAAAAAPARLDAAGLGAVSALAFSWDGSTLWALGDRSLAGWTLPAALRDGARAGHWPDQSRE